MESEKTKKEIEEIEGIFLNRSKKKSIESLSNIVFGIALSIGTFTFITQDPTMVTKNIVTFAFSFFVLIYIWFRYTRILELIKIETTVEMLLNIVMLFLVVAEPYLFIQVQFNVLPYATSAQLGPTSALFGLDIAGLMFVLGFIYVLCLRNYRYVRREIMVHFNGIRNSIFAIGVVFLIADLPMLWNVYVFGIQLRFVLWFLSVVIAIALRYVNGELYRVLDRKVV